MYKEVLFSIFVSRICFAILSVIALAVTLMIVKRPKIDSMPIVLAVVCIAVMSFVAAGKAYMAYKGPSIIVKEDVKCTRLSWSWADEISFETKNGEYIKLHRPSKRYQDTINQSLEEGHRYRIEYEGLTNILLSVEPSTE